MTDDKFIVQSGKPTFGNIKVKNTSTKSIITDSINNNGESDVSDTVPPVYEDYLNRASKVMDIMVHLAVDMDPMIFLNSGKKLNKDLMDMRAVHDDLAIPGLILG